MNKHQADPRQSIFHCFALGFLGAEKTHKLVAQAMADQDPAEYARRYGVLIAGHLADLKIVQATHESHELPRQTHLKAQHERQIQKTHEALSPILRPRKDAE